jgi:excinuclease ABC A subunit
MKKQFDRILFETTNELIGYLIKMGANPEDAKDVSQETLLKILEIETELSMDKIRPWMYRVGINLYFNLYNQTKRRAQILEQYFHVIPEEWQEYDHNLFEALLVVEHDPDVIKIADHIVDVGPLAGSHGGKIMFEGDYEQLLVSDILIGNSLKTNLPINQNPRKVADFYESQYSSLHNLKNEQLSVPKGVFTVITGVAGSGKSTLVNQVFAKDFPESIQITQTPIHTNKRSNPATYTGIMNSIRKIYAKESGIDAGFFSYNSKGACPECKGAGSIELNLSFMDKSEVECTHCHGKRYDPQVLSHQYKDKNIVDVMDMTIEEAVNFFEAKDIQRKLKNLEEVGIGYLTLGQPMDTLSGGEAQRLKLANELKTNGNIYILDEPTTGLHTSDVKNVIRIINNLVDKGNTVIVIEHNIDVICSGDWVIDLGPDGGHAGGQILFEVIVKDLQQAATITGKYL